MGWFYYDQPSVGSCIDGHRPVHAELFPVVHRSWANGFSRINSSFSKQHTGIVQASPAPCSFIVDCVGGREGASTRVGSALRFRFGSIRYAYGLGGSL